MMLRPELRPEPCPTCSGPIRETVGMVCQTCGTDYGRPEVPTLTEEERATWDIDPHLWPHTPPFHVFRALMDEDDNTWWLAGSGHGLNAYEAAVERVEELEARVAQAEAERSCVCTDVLSAVTARRIAAEQERDALAAQIARVQALAREAKVALTRVCECGFDWPEAPPPEHVCDRSAFAWTLDPDAVLAALSPAEATEAHAVIDAEHLAGQRAWSLATFGPGSRMLGVLDHIRKELAEIEADPEDVTEWVDVIILAFDGAWRAGWEPQQIIDAIKAKQARNERRRWPDWRTASPDQAIEHTAEAAEGGEGA